MKKMIRNIAKMLGVKTYYHFSATYDRDSHTGFSISGGTLGVSPWLHLDNYEKMVSEIRVDLENKGVKVNQIRLTSITKLGL
jgi:hypothetical protein